MDISKKIQEYRTKKGDKRYICRNIYIGKYSNGLQKVTDIRGKSKAEVKSKYNHMVYEFDPEAWKEKATESEVVTFNDLYQLWYPQYLKGVKESTGRGTRKRIEQHILPDLKDMKLEDISVLSLQNYYDKFMEVNGTKYYHQILQIVSKIIRYGVSIGLLDQDPTEYVIKPKVEKKKKERLYLSKEELKRFFSYLDNLDDHYINEVQKILFRVLAQSGLRIGECTALLWSDVDFQKKTISVTKSFTYSNSGWKLGTPKNVASNRVITMDENTMKRLMVFKNIQEDYLETLGMNQADEDFIFLSRNGNVLHHASIYDMLKRIVAHAELPDINIHSLRHTHATLLFESGASAKQVQTRLGHSSVKTTLDTYTHVGEDMSQKTVDTLMDYLDSKPTKVKTKVNPISRKKEQKKSPKTLIYKALGEM